MAFITPNLWIIYTITAESLSLQAPQTDIPAKGGKGFVRASMPVGKLKLPVKEAPMLRTLICAYLNILEHKQIVTEPQGLAAGGGHIP